MTEETVKIVLPLPPAILSPNRPCGSIRGRMARAAVSKKCRRLACEAVACQQVDSAPWKKATVQATFFHKQERRRDGSNYNAMLKPHQDGVVDSGLLIDDDSKHLTTLPPLFEIDKHHPRVEMVFVRIE